MDAIVRVIGMILFGVGMTWLVTVVLTRLVSRQGFAFWVWDRSGAIGRILIAAGFGLAAVGMFMGGGSTGSTLMVFGALMGMVGIWLIMPGP